jgi:hypothetical protein
MHNDLSDKNKNNTEIKIRIDNAGSIFSMDWSSIFLMDLQREGL